MESTTRRGGQICDPAVGRKRLAWEEFNEQFAGITVVVRERPDHSWLRTFPPLAQFVRASVPYRFAQPCADRCTSSSAGRHAATDQLRHGPEEPGRRAPSGGPSGRSTAACA
ncbi:hypothetical protein [Streptomyces sp. P17]|uniref:hypothetical protein n=1 Tax=Streptomyces sp. P17 TaxID=3074716 RepID=UPI0037DDDBBB